MPIRCWNQVILQDALTPVDWCLSLVTSFIAGLADSPWSALSPACWVSGQPPASTITAGTTALVFYRLWFHLSCSKHCHACGESWERCFGYWLGSWQPLCLCCGVRGKCQHCVIEELSLKEELITSASFFHTSARVGQTMIDGESRALLAPSRRQVPVNESRRQGWRCLAGLTTLLSMLESRSEWLVQGGVFADKSLCKQGPCENGQGTAALYMGKVNVVCRANSL